MDEKLQQQLVRQLKLLNFWITLFGTILVVSLLVLGFLLFKLITYVQDTADKVNNFQQQTQENLNLKKQVCGNDRLSSLLDKKTEVCN